MSREIKFKSSKYLHMGKEWEITKSISANVRKQTEFVEMKNKQLKAPVSDAFQG